MKMGIVAASAHQIGSRKSASKPKTVNVSQRTLRSMSQVYLLLPLMYYK